MSDEPALLLIGHGSRSPAGVAQFWQFSDLVQLAAPELQVSSGFIEFAEPTLDEAIDAAVAEGTSSVVAVPLVLLGAGHMKDDGPAALARGRARHPGVAFSYARDLGVHPLVLDSVAERARVAVKEPRNPRSTARTALVLVGRGSTDPDANADLYKAGRLIADNRAIGGDEELDEVQPAFVSLARPSVEEALDRTYALGARQVVVVPYFLFTGILVDRISEQAATWAAIHEDVSLAVASEIGPDRRIAALVLERFSEAASGNAAMNCDCCLYRVRMPGFEHRLGSQGLSLPTSLGGEDMGESSSGQPTRL
ncbi:MAG: sirohydrochlorin chelatase [Acidimicrobiales bacterium]